jgi:glycerol uptake facilitator-like aquaporin
MFGPVSGGHLNPVVSLADATFGGLSWRDAFAYIPAQTAGCVLGAITANGMFALAAVSISTHHRASPAHLFSEVIDTFAGIAPASVPGYVVAQFVGGACVILAVRTLYPDVTPADAAELVVPHHERPATDGAVSHPAIGA